MRTPASVKGHPIHPMLIVFPIAFWIGSLICDGIYHLGNQDPFWKDVAFYTMVGGLIGALLAAVPGLIDYRSIPVGRLKTIATTHLALNLLVAGIYVFNLGLRYNGSPAGSLFPVALSVVAILILSTSGWLGGALVYEHGVGVIEEKPMVRRDRAA